MMRRVLLTNCLLFYVWVTNVESNLQAMTTDIAVRGHDYNGRIEEFEEYDENSSARLFERSRIKALAGLLCHYVA